MCVRAPARVCGCVCTGNDEGLVVASRHFTGLEVVDVSGSSGRVTDRGVMALARAAPKLRLLDLQGSAVSAEVRVYMCLCVCVCVRVRACVRTRLF